MFNIGVYNNSKAITLDQLRTWCGAVQTQVGRDWSPIYGSYCEFSIPAGPIRYPRTIFPLYIQDKSDQPGALGYHDIDQHGVPFIKVFVEDSASAGVDLSSVISHEVLEVLGDAYVDSVVLVDNGSGAWQLYAAEVCDPVEGDTYAIRSVQVSNFITPWWFNNNAPSNVKFDFLGRLTKPLTLTPGGYFSVMPISIGQWQQQNGDRARHWNGPKSWVVPDRHYQILNLVI